MNCKILPEAPLSWRDVRIGTLYTAGLFNLERFSIGVYLDSSGIASSFDAAGSIFALTLWVNYAA